MGYNVHMIIQDVKENVANNLILLRKAKGMTQADVAKELNYSDKSVSKWEHADSLPDISILSALAEMYGVTLDFLVYGNAEEELKGEEKKDNKNVERQNRIVVMCMSVTAVFLIAVIAFVYSIWEANFIFWQAFVWAIPVSSIVLLRYQHKWIKNKTFETVLASVLIWSLITAVCLQFTKYQLWLCYIVGIPIQIIILLANRLYR